MPLYNAEKYVAEAIQSVINQTYTYWELIIVNDGSTDDSLSVAKRFESDKIKVYAQTNKGQCAANNFGYSKSNGNYIKFFDADDILSSNMLAGQLLLIDSRNDILVSAQWGRFYLNDLSTFKLSKEECWQDMNPVDWLCSSWQNGQSMMQCALWLIPRKILEMSGLWDERLSLINDLEFFTRVILASTDIKFCSTATLYYRSGLHNALSGNKSKLAIKSAYLSIDLATKKFLSCEMSTITQLCCANLWQTFIYEFYYSQPDLAKQAELKVQNLGGSNLDFPCGGYTKMLSKVVGWKVAKWIREKIFS